MKNLIYAVMICGLISCGDATEQTKKSVTGIVKDATMNTLMLKTDSCQVYLFSTMDVVKEDINGILLGDKVQVVYTGELTETADPQSVTVAKIVEIEQDPILGCWTQPVPGMEGVQGIKIMEGGVAESINMSTLVYKSWTRDSLFLVLTGQSIGNNQTLDFTDTMIIQTLDDMNLVLAKEGVENIYTKDRDMMVQ